MSKIINYRGGYRPVFWACTAVVPTTALFRPIPTVQEKWAQVQTQYQRRSDLIPNLVRTVQGAANFEKSTLTAVIQARASATQVIKLTADQLTPENVQKFQAAQDQLSGSLSRLLAVAESYPQSESHPEFLRNCRRSWKALKTELRWRGMISTVP
jgi:hypothetical protein